MIIEQEVTMGKRGQIVIPKAIRQKEGIKPKQKLKMINVGGSITIRNIDSASVEDEILEVLQKAHLTDEDWEEIQRDRERE